MQKTGSLVSAGVSDPLYDVMKNKDIKKYMLGGYQDKYKFKQIRRKLREIDRKDHDIPATIKFK